MVRYVSQLSISFNHVTNKWCKACLKQLGCCKFWHFIYLFCFIYYQKPYTSSGIKNHFLLQGNIRDLNTSNNNNMDHNKSNSKKDQITSSKWTFTTFHKKDFFQCLTYKVYQRFTAAQWWLITLIPCNEIVPVDCKWMMPKEKFYFDKGRERKRKIPRRYLKKLK